MTSGNSTHKQSSIKLLILSVFLRSIAVLEADVKTLEAEYDKMQEIMGCGEVDGFDAKIFGCMTEFFWWSKNVAAPIPLLATLSLDTKIMGALFLMFSHSKEIQKGAYY